MEYEDVARKGQEQKHHNAGTAPKKVKTRLQRLFLMIGLAMPSFGDIRPKTNC